MSGLIMRRKQKGFTLVELLVVITILGILMAIILPVLRLVINSARKTQAREDLHQIVVGWKGYLTEYRHFPHDATNGMAVITCMCTNAMDVLNGIKYGNPNIKYMEFTGDEGKTGFLDPWGRRKYQRGDITWQDHVYQVALDNGQGYDTTPAYDGQISVPHKSRPVLNDVYAWSRGPDGKDASMDDQRDDIIGN